MIYFTVSFVLIKLLVTSGEELANPQWAFGKFIKQDSVNPIIKPLNTTFNDPITLKPVQWEHDHTFNPAAVVRDGKVNFNLCE